MFAVIKTGGRQYRVEKGSIIKVNKLNGEVGKAINLESVLLVVSDKDIKVGSTDLKGAKVVAEVLEQKKDKKIIVFKKHRRQTYRRKKGHRQEITVLKIKDIKVS